MSIYNHVESNFNHDFFPNCQNTMPSLYSCLFFIQENTRNIKSVKLITQTKQ